MKRYKVRILPSAYNDLKSARSWYRQHSPLLPKRLSQLVNRSIERIRQTPFAHAVRYQEVRIANINIFPYAIHYFLEENTIIIIAIHHTAISPDEWMKRL
jgi:plasmid stabilization system protein ParE